MSTALSPGAARWVKFNLVGGLGVGLQLSLITLFNGPLGLPYLVSTALAVELTVLHNFAWHERCTWRERGSSGGRGSVGGRLARFHASNGAVSIAGNLLLMSVFTGRLHLPVLLANGIAITVCSLVNFFLADRWVFAPRHNG